MRYLLLFTFSFGHRSADFLGGYFDLLHDATQTRACCIISFAEFVRVNFCCGNEFFQFCDLFHDSNFKMNI